VAHIKLAWWRDEIRRLAANSPAHPITRYVAAMPLAAAVDLASLEQSVLAAGAQVAGAPLERASELAAHSFSLYGTPLLVAGKLAGGDGGGAHAPGVDTRGVHAPGVEAPGADTRGAHAPGVEAPGVSACIAGLAAAEYLFRSAADYGRDVRAGRVPFPVDELLAAKIEDADLAAPEPPPSLQHYLSQLRGRTARHLADASRAMSSVPPPTRSLQRHLVILAALGAKHVDEGRNPSHADFRLSDLYNAWTAARHAARGR
jgi:phytoene synthase